MNVENKHFKTYPIEAQFLLSLLLLFILYFYLLFSHSGQKQVKVVQLVNYDLSYV